MLEFPMSVISGAAGFFAKTLVQFLETPTIFLFFSYLTLLGHLISGRISIESATDTQPRFYTILLGESAFTRKSTSINKTVSFFDSMLEILGAFFPMHLNILRGVGSAEGLAQELTEKSNLILVIDELNTLVRKCQADGSVLLPCVNTLFESNKYQNRTKKNNLRVDDGHLCILGASTLDTYQNMFSSQFLDIGFLNRFFIVIGNGERKFPIPVLIPPDILARLQFRHMMIIRHLNKLVAKADGGIYRLPIEDEANDIFSAWYFKLRETIFTKRLDTYGLRLMILLAVNERKTTISADIVRKVVAILEYQLAARQYADPIDAINAVAKLEERIRRVLIEGPKTNRQLIRKLNKSYYGNELWGLAVDNLKKAKEVIYTSFNKTYRLNEDYTKQLEQE